MDSRPPDLVAVSQRMQQTWATGDFAVIGIPQVIVGEILCEAVDLRSGSIVLDIACGAGNTAIAAARRYCEVTGIDFVPALLERGRERAQVERLDVEFIEGDAAALPFDDASFDVVLSTFGVMFAPDQAQAAAELLRVCRPGGAIGLANWTPEGFVGQHLALTAGYLPPPPGLMPPTRWGTEEGLRTLFGDAVSEIRIERQNFNFRHPSPEHWIAIFQEYFGPVVRAFNALDAAGKDQYTADLIDLLHGFNRSGNDTLVAPSEYLEVVAIRR